MEIPILKEIVVILGLSILIILTFQRFGIPSILGFLLAGIISGPHGFNLISSTHEVELLSEIGIIFLLFIIGIEFSIKGLMSIKEKVILGGALQVGGVITATALLSIWMGLPLNTAVFLGFLFSLSSTAIVLKILQEKGEINSPHGRFSVAILIFQDIIVVPMMLLTPILAGKADNLALTLGLMVAKVALVLLVVYLLAKYIVPVILKMVVRTKNRELFLLTITVFCFAVAWLTSSVGLSLALGAFFAGLIISESDYSHQATANVLPFREIFISFFFISVGTLLDLGFFFENILLINALAIAVTLMKMAIVGLVVYVFRYPSRTVVLTAFGLFQVGEFSLLLSGYGMDEGILSENLYQYFLAVSILTMAGTPFLIDWAPAVSHFLLRLPLPAPVLRKMNQPAQRKGAEPVREENLRDHLVIIGYGINGENLAKAAKSADIPYAILDLNPTAFENARLRNEPVVFGDATDPLILKHVHVHEARVVVIAISDPLATKKIITQIRIFTKTACIIVRTRYVKEMDEHHRLGADEVIPEEFETSIQIFTRVMKKYLVPQDEILSFIAQLRSSDYEMLTTTEELEKAGRLPILHIPDKEVTTLKVQQRSNKVVGRALAESGIRKNYNVNVLAIRRGEEYISEISPETVILEGDLLFLFGNPQDINHLNEMF